MQKRLCEAFEHLKLSISCSFKNIDQGTSGAESLPFILSWRPYVYKYAEWAPAEPQKEVSWRQ